MSEYDFSALAPNEFEDLCKDLLEKHLGAPLQAFTTGRDGGIDLRHCPVVGKDWIVQCKHYSGSRFTDLKKSVSKEVKKLARLKPGRYILATSCRLTPPNVDSLYTLLSPYCVSKHDIIGKTDLNGIIRKNGDIERRNLKLWITSEAVTNRVLHNDVFVQSDLSEQSIKKRLSLYVYNPKYTEACKKLDESRVCIISGVPGVGKTTLAEMLIIEHLMDGWELVTIHQNVSESLRILRSDPQARQILYYDDFLGQISSGEKLGKNEDEILLQLFRAVQQNHKKRFILTTREYILTQAKREHEKLARASLDIFRFVIECQDYDEEAKARILANHLYFNQVPQEHIAAIVDAKSYTKIISHRNYSPRLIETVTSLKEVSACKPSNYLGLILSHLDDPSQLWDHAYQEQLSESSCQLMLALVINDTPILVSQLELDFEALYAYRCKEYGWKRRVTDFERSLNEIEGDIIRIRGRDDGTYIEWHNPSVIDFMSNWLARHTRDVEDLLRTATRFRQIEQLMTRVPVMLQARGAAVGARIDERVLADALGRTTMIERATWSQLQSAVRLCESFPGGAVRASIQLLLEKAFASLESEGGNITTVLSVLNIVSGQPWLPGNVLQVWEKMLKAHVLSLGEECVDQVEELIEVSYWIVKGSLLSETELLEFKHSAARIVENETNASIWPNTEDVWIGIREGVEQVQTILGLDFSREIERIDSKIESADKPDIQQKNVPRQITKPTQATSIDSIFDSLLI